MKQIVFFTQVLNEHVVIGPTNDQTLQQRIDETKAMLSSTRPGAVSFIEIRGVVPVVTGGVNLAAVLEDQVLVQSNQCLLQSIEESLLHTLSKAASPRPETEPSAHR